MLNYLMKQPIEQPKVTLFNYLPVNNFSQRHSKLFQIKIDSDHNGCLFRNPTSKWRKLDLENDAARHSEQKSTK